MASFLITVFATIIFYFLTPGVILRIPKNGKTWTVAAVHALVFFLVFLVTQYIYGYYSQYKLPRYEGLDNATTSDPSANDTEPTELPTDKIPPTTANPTYITKYVKKTAPPQK